MKKTALLSSWSLWLLAAVFYALDYFQHTAPSVLLAPIAVSLHVSITQVGTIMSLYFPFYAISQIPAGILLDRYPLRYVLSGACGVVTLGLWLMMSGHYEGVLVGRILIAVGSSCAFLGALKTASLYLPATVFPIAVGLTNTIGVLGGILGQAYLNHLILAHGWEAALLRIVFFGIGLSLVLLWALKGKADKQKHSTHSSRPWSVLYHPQLWLLALYAGIMVGTVVNAFSELYDVVFLQQVFHLGSQSAAEISSMIFIGIAVGGPSHGVIAKWTGKRAWMIWGCALTLLCFSLMILTTQLALPVGILYGLYFLIGFFVSSMLLSFAMVGSLLPKEHQAIGFGLLNMVIGFCGFVFQWGLGIVLHANAHTLEPHHQVFVKSFLILLIPLLLSLGLVFGVRRERQG